MTAPPTSALDFDEIFSPHAPVAFEAAFTPWLQAAWNDLLTRRRGEVESFGVVALRCHLHTLAGRCSDTAAMTLGLLLASRAAVDPLDLWLEDDDDAYRALVDEVRRGAGGLAEFPVLGRLLGAVARGWTEDVVALLDAFMADRAALPDGPVEAIEPLSPRVLGLRFSGSVKIVYKARRASAEGAFFEILERFGGELGARLPWRHVGHDATWMTHVEARPCVSRDEAATFYRRAGGLGAFLWALCATDGHCGNLAACGDRPVLLDAECVMQPGLWSTTFPWTPHGTGLFPRASRERDFSALGCTAPQATGRGRLVWRDVNTDRMTPCRVDAVIEPRANVVRIAGIVIDPCEFRNEILEGFEDGYHRIASSRDALRADLEARAQTIESHVPIIATMTLNECMQRLAQPARLRDDRAAATAFEPLNDLLPPLRETAIDALWHMRLPRFLARIDGCELRADPQGLETAGAGRNEPGGAVPRRVDGLIVRSSLHRICEVLAAMSDDDCRAQSACIAEALDARNAEWETAS